MQFSEINALGEMLSFSSDLRTRAVQGPWRRLSLLPEYSSEATWNPASAFFVFGGQTRLVALLLPACLQLPLVLMYKAQGRCSFTGPGSDFLS